MGLLGCLLSSVGVSLSIWQEQGTLFYGGLLDTLVYQYPAKQIEANLDTLAWSFPGALVCFGHVVCCFARGLPGLLSSLLISGFASLGTTAGVRVLLPQRRCY